MRNPQLNRLGELAHLITTEGLSRAILTRLLDAAESFRMQPDEGLDKVSALQGKKIRTLATDLAFTESAQYVLPDADILMVRSEFSGLPYLIARQLGPQVHVINEGDGCHAAPMRALMDMLTIRDDKKDFSNLIVVLVGDILHSPVARSNFHALTTFGVAEVRVVAPLTLLPEGLAQLGVQVFTKMTEGLRDADVVIVLELEQACSENACLPSAQEYFNCYGLTAEHLTCAKSDCLVIDGSANRDALALAVRKGVMSIVAGATS